VAWSGLGYNRRALTLREAARRIVDDHAALVPGTVAELETLPGIGPYTARAVAATAFGTPVAALDVNVRRVVSRVAGTDARSRELQATADALVDRREPRRWLNAVMDLASGVCTPTGPRCEACPLAGMCASRGEVPAERVRGRSLPFPQTTRWLRGRLVASFSRAPAGTWMPLPDQLGTHDAAAIAVAAEALRAEGFLELRDGHARVTP
jgi:A/G-specific adenine glycosylase